MGPHWYLRVTLQMQTEAGRSPMVGSPHASTFEDRLTPAEGRYLQRREQSELERLAKMASKSHRDRIHEFNRYLANLSEHYDIPNVGPG